MVNASIAAMHAANATQYEEFWVCFSSQPPFYEGVAVFGSTIATNDTNKLGWHPKSNEGLTLSQVSGLGLCLLGPSMLPPQALLEVCNQTIVVNATFHYLGAPNGTYIASFTGLTTYVVTQTFLAKRDYCVLVQLLPKLTVHHAEDLLQFWEVGTNLPRDKREPISAVTLAVILGLGAAGTGTGIASLVTSQQQYTQLSLDVDRDIQELQKGLKNLKDSLVSLSEVVLQNR
jgi:hypothetical protein